MRRLSLSLRKIKIDQTVQVSWLFFLTAWAVLQFWQSRFFEFYGDAISYIDMADHFSRNEWANGISYWWSPLYPLIVSCFFRVIHPEALNEFAILKLVNLTIFLILLASFEYFLYVLMRFYDDQMRLDSNVHGLARWLWIFVAHAAFAYAFLCLNSIAVDTPDMLMAALMFIALSVFLKILRGQNTFGNYFLFGLFTGMAYLAKCAALPSMLACLPFLLQQRNKTNRFWQKLILSVIALAMVTVPYIAYISHQSGELILFPGGKLNYIWYVQEKRFDLNAQTDKDAGQLLLHPTRQILANPDVFEFSGPLQATYPPWFDPYYWRQGCTIHLCPDWMAITIICNVVYYGAILFLPFLIVITIIYLIYGGPIFSIQSLVSNAVLFIPALVGFLQYMGVVNLLVLPPDFVDRYFGLFIVLFILASLSSLRIKENLRGKRALFLGVTLTCLCLFIPIGQQLKRDISDPLGNQPSAYYQMPSALAKVGLHPGDRIARVGDGDQIITDWARICRLKIVVDIAKSNEFWSVSPNRRLELLNKLKKYGVKMAIYFTAPPSMPSKRVEEFAAKHPTREWVLILKNKNRIPKPNPPPTEGWNQLGDLPCWIHKI